MAQGDNTESNPVPDGASEKDIELGRVTVRWMMREAGDYVDVTISDQLKKFDAIKILTVAQHEALTSLHQP